MAEMHTGDVTDAQGAAGRTLKRRGILAAAGAAVAGIVAKQIAQPVAAGTDHQALIIAEPNTASTAGTSLSWTGGTISNGAVLAAADTGGPSLGSFSAMLAGITTNFKADNGVFGYGGIGVRGIGQAGGIGVYGASTGDIFSSGVQGTNDVGYGVTGASSSGTGVYGASTGTAANGNGVYGFVYHVGSTQVTAGVFGDSNASYGVLGRTTAPFYSGCTGIATLPNTAAFAGSGVGGAYAAYFTGPTVVAGNFTVVGGQKNAAVKHTDGSYRLLHCVESPEAWFEDFGEAKLVNGRADVKLDADFAAVVDTSAYHVFLTPRDAANKGLAVTTQRGNGFAVQELHGGTSSGSFSYRIVARRKDLSRVERLAKFDLPKIRLPKPEEMPPPSTALKKP